MQSSSHSVVPLIVPLLVAIAVITPLLSIIFIWAKKKLRIIWFSLSMVLFGVFFCVGLGTHEPFFWIIGLFFALVADFILIGTMFQAGMESRKKAAEATARGISGA